MKNLAIFILLATVVNTVSATVPPKPLSLVEKAFTKKTQKIEPANIEPEQEIIEVKSIKTNPKTVNSVRAVTVNKPIVVKKSVNSEATLNKKTSLENMMAASDGMKLQAISTKKTKPSVIILKEKN